MAKVQTDPNINFDGVDLSSVLLENKKLKPRELFWRFGDKKAIRKGDWKLLNTNENKHLFNLGNDLGEETDLSEKYPEIFERLSLDLDEWEEKILKDVKMIAER